MEDRVDDSSLRLHIIENDVGKSPDKGSAKVGQDGGIHQRMPLQGQKRRLHAPQEFQTQADGLLLVQASASAMSCLAAGRRCGSLALGFKDRPLDLGPRSGRVRVPQVLLPTTIKLRFLPFGNRQVLPLGSSNTVPKVLDELKSLGQG